MKTEKEVRELLIAKAEGDQTFRGLLLDDPRTAVSEITGMTVPEKISLHVHEQSATDLHLVLPPAGKLSLEDMDDVAGGNIYNFLDT